MIQLVNYEEKLWYYIDPHPSSHRCATLSYQ